MSVFLAVFSCKVNLLISCYTDISFTIDCKAGYTFIAFCILRTFHKKWRQCDNWWNDLYTLLAFRIIFFSQSTKKNQFLWHFLQKPPFFAEWREMRNAKNLFQEPLETLWKFLYTLAFRILWSFRDKFVAGLRPSIWTDRHFLRFPCVCAPSKYSGIPYMVPWINSWKEFIKFN